jgi:hypothetical protein
MSIMSDESTPSNSGKWELMHHVQKVNSQLPPLDGVDPSDMIYIDYVQKLKIRNFCSSIFPKNLTYVYIWSKNNVVDKIKC